MCKCVKVILYCVTISLHASSRGRGIGTGSRPCRLASGTSRRGWWTRRSSQRSRRCSTAFTIITSGSLIRLYIHQSADAFIVLSGYLILTSWEWEREVWEIRWASIFHSELRVKESGQVGKKTNTPTKYISIGMRFASKRAVDTENSTEAGSSKLMVGLVDKRKPGMEFLGKR